MAGNETITGRLQQPSYTAAELARVDPLLLAGEVVYESDTGRHKVGNGVNRWSGLRYSSDANEIPALAWKVEDGILCVRPACDLENPILRRCYVGILHYKNARARTHLNTETGLKERRLNNAGYKLVDDSHAGASVTWTSTRINPVPYGVPSWSGWMEVIPVQTLFSRWVSSETDARYVNSRKYILHRGRNKGEYKFEELLNGKIKQKVTFYCGVVLYVLDDKKRRIEGPRSYFKIEASNYGSAPPRLRHL